MAMLDTPRANRPLRGLLAAALLAFPVGCGRPPDMPRTYAVKGRVVYKDGTPLAGSLVEFCPAGQVIGSVTGQVGPDGLFTLTTHTDQGAVPGAPEGQYSVTIMPKLEGDQTKTHGARPLTVKQKVTVKPDDSNDFSITLDQAPPRH
jgi:hypothetical protein